MIEPFVNWLRTLETLPFDATGLADHLATKSLLIVQDSDTVREFSGVWKDTVVPIGTRVIAVQTEGSWHVVAMVDTHEANLTQFLSRQLGYVPSHMLFEWQSLPTDEITVHLSCGIIGRHGIVETFKDALVSVISIEGVRPSAAEAKLMREARDGYGLWRFEGYEALHSRYMIGQRVNVASPKMVVVKPILGKHNGIH